MQFMQAQMSDVVSSYKGDCIYRARAHMLVVDVIWHMSKMHVYMCVWTPPHTHIHI